MKNLSPLYLIDEAVCIVRKTARSKRKALNGELPDDVRAVEAQLSICDDFMPQFAVASEPGRQFSDAWFNARQTIDLGRRASKPNPPTPPAPSHP